MSDNDLKDKYENKKLLFQEALEEVEKQSTKQNINMKLVEEYYFEIKKLLEKGYTLAQIAKTICEKTGMSESTFKKNYNTIKNKKIKKSIVKNDKKEIAQGKEIKPKKDESVQKEAENNTFKVSDDNI